VEIFSLLNLGLSCRNFVSEWRRNLGQGQKNEDISGAFTNQRNLATEIMPPYYPKAKRIIFSF
jgi:hypothetical protein